jgi:hypothetical protein
MFLHRTGLAATVLVSLFIFLPLAGQSADATIAWEANTDQNLEGRGIYFRRGSDGPPYTLYGYAAIEELETSSCFIQTLGGKSRLIGWVRLLSAVCLGALVRYAWRLRPACSTSAKRQGPLNSAGRARCR